MRIWLSEEPGGPETLVLRERPAPIAAAGEVLVEVRAAGINYPDTLIIEDRYQFRPGRPFAPGGEIAGVVLATGAGVLGFAPGDRVIARTGWGGLAEQIAIEATRCVAMPDTLGFAEGAAFLFTYGTSYHALHQRGRIAAGETVLVLGAAGGTGIAAIEIAKAAGARVVAAASSDHKATFARAAGADVAVVYPRGPLDREAARALTDLFKNNLGSGGADIVYDPVGGDYAEPALRAIAWRGRYLVVGFAAGIPRLPFNLPLLKGCEIVGVFNGGFQANESALAANNVAILMRLIADGRLHPRVSRRYPMMEAPEAIRAIGAREALGKLVVTMSPDEAST